MLNVIYYTKENCALCDDAKELLLLLQNEYPFEIEERDIYSRDEWLEQYHLVIPYVQINDISLNGAEINISTLEQALKKAIS